MPLTEQFGSSPCVVLDEGRDRVCFLVVGDFDSLQGSLCAQHGSICSLRSKPKPSHAVGAMHRCLTRAEGETSGKVAALTLLLLFFFCEEPEPVLCSDDINVEESLLLCFLFVYLPTGAARQLSRLQSTELLTAHTPLNPPAVFHFLSFCYP